MLLYNYNFNLNNKKYSYIKTEAQKMELLNKTMYIYIKYEYLSRYGDPGEELYEITTTEGATIKDIKDEINKSFIYGELDPEQYEIYKGMEQEDKAKARTDREPQTHYYIYLEPQLMDDDNKTIKECNIANDETLHLKPKLKLILKIPCCRFNTIYLYTYNTLKDILKEAVKIYYKKTNSEIELWQMTAFYGDTELEKHEHLSTYNIYNNSTITINIDYNIK